MTNEAMDQVKVVRLELHEELLKIPQYRALTALDELLKIFDKIAADTEKAVTQDPATTVAVAPPSAPEPAPVVPTPAPEPERTVVRLPVKKDSKPMTQVQALLHVLRKKETPASLGWLIAELELLGVTVGGTSPRKTIGVALSSNKELFRRVEFDGGRWMWGLANRKYAGETTYDHLPPTKFKSMRVTRR